MTGVQTCALPISFLGVNFDFDERESDEFDSECGDEISVDEGEDSNFGFENIYSSGDSVNNSAKIARVCIKTGEMGGKKNSKNEIRNDCEVAKSADQSGTAAVVTEFLFRLFPGRSIFIKKKNLLGIVSVQHRYLSMFAASTVTQTRTIRFFNLLSLILTSIFADTVFFGIFFPAHSTCTSMTNKV